MKMNWFPPQFVKFCFHNHLTVLCTAAANMHIFNKEKVNKKLDKPNTKINLLYMLYLHLTVIILCYLTSKLHNNMPKTKTCY